jgi:CheY-like chemotaxis protein
MSPSPNNGDAPRCRALVVDDEPTLRLGFAYALTSKSTVVETAASGRLALERLANSNYDIMFLDLRMPEMDGIGVIENLRGQGNQIPIVLCSAALSPNAAVRAIRHGVVHFLLKPVRPVDLRQVMASILHPENSPLPQALQAARNGKRLEAIRLLENEATVCKHAAYWHQILKAVEEMKSDEDTTRLEEKVRASLTLLAFNTAA